MPVHIKLFISAMAAIIVGGFGYTQLAGPRPEIAYVGFALAAMMVLAIWIFPETGKVKARSKNRPTG